MNGNQWVIDEGSVDELVENLETKTKKVELLILGKVHCNGLCYVPQHLLEAVGSCKAIGYCIIIKIQIQSKWNICIYEI